MTTIALRLFGARVVASHDVGAITESSPEKLRLARTTGRTVLDGYEDAPQTIEEVEDGMVVIGGSHAVFLPGSGEVTVRPIGEARGSKKPLPSKNDSYGFQGSVRLLIGGAPELFEAMGKALIAAFPAHSPETIRGFLDSKFGRYLSDVLTHHAPQTSYNEYTFDSLLKAIPRAVKETKWIAKELDAYAKLPPEDTDEDDGSASTLSEAGSKGDDFDDFESGVQKKYGLALRKDRFKVGAKLPDGRTIRTINKSLARTSFEKNMKALGMTDVEVGASWVVWGGRTVRLLGTVTLDRGPDRYAMEVVSGTNKGYVLLPNDANVGDSAYYGELRPAGMKQADFDKTFRDNFGKVFEGERRNRFKESKDNEPMTTRLREDEYADIVVGEDGLLLLVNGDIVATETCDLNDETDCKRAEDALSKQAQALGYTQVVEGSFDASRIGGGPVRNGDEFDDWAKGESYYARRYRRRTSDSQTGRPTQPALESEIPEIEIRVVRTGPGGAHVVEYWLEGQEKLAEQLLSEFRDGKVPAEVLAVGGVDERGIPPQFRKKKDKERDREADDDEDEDEDMEERLIGESADFLAHILSLGESADTVREFDVLVRSGDYEGAIDLAETIAISKNALVEYRRRTGTSLSKFRRSLKMQTSQEKVRNRQRRREYRTNTTMRRKAARYRVRVKRFRRRYESISVDEARATKAQAESRRRAGYKFAVWSTADDVTYHKTRAEAEAEAEENPAEGRTWTDIKELIGVLESIAEAEDLTWRNAVAGKASADDTLAQIVAGVFADLKAAYTGFAGLKERVQKVTGEDVSDPKLMKVVSEFVQRGLLTYTAGKGYALIEVADDALGKLASAARKSGHKAVVTISGGVPVFLPTMEDANELWKSIPTKMRGGKMTLSNYMKQLGMDDEPGES